MDNNDDEEKDDDDMTPHRISSACQRQSGAENFNSKSVTGVDANADTGASRVLHFNFVGLR